MLLKEITAQRRPTFRVSKRLMYVPGQVIIRFKQDAIPRVGGRALTSASHMALAFARIPEAVSRPLDFLREHAGLKQMRTLFADGVPPAMKFAGIRGGAHLATLMMSAARSPSEELRGFNVASLDQAQMTPDLFKRLAASPAVEFVERMPARWLAAKAADPMQGSQWGLHAIGWFDQALPGARNVTVAVLDTGVDMAHPDLRKMVAAYDHGGFSAEDIVGHGTHVSGIIAATVNNRVGISGIADCRLKVWKIFSDTPQRGDYYVDGERYLQALREVEDSGARVVNLSIGGGAPSQTEALLFRRLASRGIAVVAAMGNEYDEGNPVEYPAAYGGVLAVGAVDPRLERAGFSNTGAHIHVVAPGVGILSTLPMKKSSTRDETRYAAWDGTSMATPHVAACVALLLAKVPGLDAVGVRMRLRKRARRLAGMKGKVKTPQHGYGLVYLPNLLK